MRAATHTDARTSSTAALARALAAATLCCVLLGLAISAQAHALPTIYKVQSAKLDVIETGSFKSSTKVSWNGEGHSHQTLEEPNEEEGDALPPLPAIVPSSGGGIVIRTDLLLDGHETFIDAEGATDKCSGSWNEPETSGFTVKLKPLARERLKTTWELHTDLASHNCGVGYSLIAGGTLLVSETQRGRIGEKHLTLAIKGEKSFNEARREGTVEQVVKWTGKVVLEKTKIQVH